MLNFIDKKFWKNKKVFITGHTGFKGCWLTLFLNYLGADVTGYSLPPNTRPSLFNLARIKNVVRKSIIADIRDYKRLQNELEKSKASDREGLSFQIDKDIENQLLITVSPCGFLIRS